MDWINMQRYIVEFGIGMDSHGSDMTEAAKEAVKDAISYSCLCEIGETLGLKNPAEELYIRVKIMCPKPEEVVVDEIKKVLFYQNVDVELLHVSPSNEGDDITTVIAMLTVYAKRTKHL